MTDAPNPKPSERDDFLGWMVGRRFRYDTGSRSVYFEGIEPVIEQSEVATESGTEITETVRSNSVYLRVEMLDTTTETVEGDSASAVVPKVDSADGDGEQQKIPFDTLRVGWIQGTVEEL